MKAKYALLASLAAATCFNSYTVSADQSSKDWVAYREANGLPTTAVSNPVTSSDELIMEMSLDEGNADRAALVREIHAKNGNGNGHSNGNGGQAEQGCPADFLKEIARTDGNPYGDDRSCDFRAP
jgi:hypothetical protein